MNGKLPQICVAALLVIAGCAVFLGTWQQRLGVPGVRVVNEPTYGIDDVAEGVTNTFLATTKSIYLPAQVLDYDSESMPVTKQVLDWLPKDTTYGQRFYRSKDGFSVQVMAVLMGKDRTSIHQPQYCLGSQGWQKLSEELMAILIEQPKPYNLPVMKLKVSQTFR